MNQCCERGKDGWERHLGSAAQRLNSFIRAPRGKLEKRERGGSTWYCLNFISRIATCPGARRRRRRRRRRRSGGEEEGKGRCAGRKARGKYRAGRRERARPDAAGHFSLLCVPFVRVT